MTKHYSQAAADNFFFLIDHFQGAARQFCDGTDAKGIAPWEDIWTSQALVSSLREIAQDMEAEGQMNEDQLNDWVDARLKALPWVSIAASVA